MGRSRFPTAVACQPTTDEDPHCNAALGNYGQTSGAASGACLSPLYYRFLPMFTDFYRFFGLSWETSPQTDLTPDVCVMLSKLLSGHGALAPREWSATPVRHWQKSSASSTGTRGPRPRLSSTVHIADLGLSTIAGSAYVKRIPFGDHPLKLERYRED